MEKKWIAPHYSVFKDVIWNVHKSWNQTNFILPANVPKSDASEGGALLSYGPALYLKFHGNNDEESCLSH
jgi:hypothetical protein